MNKHDCNASHVPWPIIWKCPDCGNEEHFFVIETDEVASDICDGLHAADWCECEICGYQGNGKEVSRLLTSKRIKCTHCNGTGWIVKE